VKVQIFENNIFEKLQDKINKFLEKSIKVLFIKQSECYSPEHGDIYLTISIFYEEL
jgi:hypothetical protein